MNRKVVALLGMWAGLVFAGSFAAAVYAYDVPNFSRNWYYGYFSNSYDSSGDDVFQNDANDLGNCSGTAGNRGNHYNSSTGAYDAIWPSATYANQFIYEIETFLNSTRCDLSTANNAQNWDRTSAAFIINTMLGHGGGSSRSISAADLADWENRVRVMDAAGRINWNVYVSAAPNTFYQISRWDGSSSVNDDAWYSSAANGQAIVFYDGNWNASYIIRRNCANPLGYPTAIPNGWAANGYSTVSDSNDPDTNGDIMTSPGDTLTFKHHIVNNGPGGSWHIWYELGGWYGGSGTQWTANYYNNTTLSGSPVLTRSENNINYQDWVGNVSPGPGVLADGFSARWTKTENFPAGSTRFTMKVDDGGRLYIDGTLVLNFWIAQGATSYNYTANLTAGNHTITMEYYEQGGPGVAMLGYSNVTVLPGTDSGAYNNGQNNTVNTNTFTVPANAVAGTQYCQRILWDNKNSRGAGGGDYGTTNTSQAWGDEVCATVSAPPVSSSCGGATTSPGTFDPTDPYTVTAIINTSGGSAGAQTVSNNSNTYIHVSGPGVSFADDNSPTTVGGSASSSGTGTLTSTDSPGPTNSAGVYTVTYGVVGPVGAISCSSTFNVAYTPYFAISSGDIAAGPGFGTACAPSLSGIIGKNTGSGSGYYGASTQLGAFALGQITGFATDTNRNTSTATASSTSGSSATQPSGLAFSNSGTSSTVWGTTFGKDPTDDPADNPSFCVPDYYSAALNATPAPTVLAASGGYFMSQANLNSLTSGKTYVINGNLQTSGDASGNLYLGGAGQPSRVTLVVNGNVWLNSNVKYNAYNYVSGTSTASVVPQFQLIVNGNIFIDEGVTITAGFYVAQGSGTSGNIFTCASGYNYLTYTSGDTAPWYKWDTNYYNDCNTGLTVYGALAARHIMFNRSAGHWKPGAGVSDGAAEKVVYDPELWLGSMNGVTGASSANTFDSITNLPPIL